MATATIEVPENLLALMAQSRLGSRPLSEQIQVALAIHLFQEGVVSVGKAAELAAEPRPSFERLLADMGIPPVRYDAADYEQDLLGIAAAERRSGAA